MVITWSHNACTTRPPKVRWACGDGSGGGGIGCLPVGRSTDDHLAERRPAGRVGCHLAAGPRADHRRRGLRDAEDLGRATVRGDQAPRPAGRLGDRAGTAGAGPGADSRRDRHCREGGPGHRVRPAADHLHRRSLAAVLRSRQGKPYVDRRVPGDREARVELGDRDRAMGPQRAKRRQPA